MGIRLIGTDTDYKEALAEVERLWGAAPGTPEEAKLELLAMLVHNYERSREPPCQRSPSQPEPKPSKTKKRRR